MLYGFCFTSSLKQGKSLVVRAGISVTWTVLSWSGGHEFELQSGWTWGVCTSVLSRTWTKNVKYTMSGSTPVAEYYAKTQMESLKFQRESDRSHVWQVVTMKRKWSVTCMTDCDHEEKVISHMYDRLWLWRESDPVTCMTGCDHEEKVIGYMYDRLWPWRESDWLHVWQVVTMKRKWLVTCMTDCDHEEKVISDMYDRLWPWRESDQWHVWQVVTIFYYAPCIKRTISTGSSSSVMLHVQREQAALAAHLLLCSMYKRTSSTGSSSSVMLHVQKNKQHWQLIFCYAPCTKRTISTGSSSSVMLHVQREQSAPAAHLLLSSMYKENNQHWQLIFC